MGTEGLGFSEPSPVVLRRECPGPACSPVWPRGGSDRSPELTGTDRLTD